MSVACNGQLNQWFSMNVTVTPGSLDVVDLSAGSCKQSGQCIGGLMLNESRICVKKL